MGFGIEVFNQNGQRTVAVGAAQQVLIYKGSGNTAARNGIGGVLRSHAINFEMNYFPTFVGVVCSVMHTIEKLYINGKWRVTVHVERGTVVPVTVYCFTDIRIINPAPSTTGAGLELYDETGKVSYSSKFPHLKIKHVATVLSSATSVSVPTLSDVALASSAYQANHEFSDVYTPEGYWTYQRQRGFLLGGSTITSADVMIEYIQQLNRPIVVPYNYNVNLMLIDTANINALYPSSYIRA